MSDHREYSTATPQEALERLDRHSRELDELSGFLHKLQLRLDGTDGEPGVAQRYDEAIDAYELKRYMDSESGGVKMPSTAAMLRRLARHAIDPELLYEYDGLLAKRRRLEQRISDLGRIIRAEISILSALKTIAEVE